MTIQRELQRAATRAIKGAFPDIELEAEVVASTQSGFGHYQCNNAMRLAKMVGQSPRDVAARIADHLDDLLIDRVEVAGPGFLNITLCSEALSERLISQGSDRRFGVAKPTSPKRVIVEFSSPNVAKELHVGHLRSTIIGEALARLFEFLGGDVIRLNHVGDWGTQFGMLISYIKSDHPEAISRPEQFDLPTLMRWYREAKRAFDADVTFQEASRREVVSLQSGDPDSKGVWEAICAISRRAYDEIYHLLDAQLSERGESFYNEMLPQVAAELTEKGIAIRSDGALCAFADGYETPMIVQKSDGGYTYDTTDLAALKHRIDDERADRIIVVTDNGQRLHFDLLRAVAIAAGWLDESKTQFDHVTFGVVLGPDGKKFKTRSGETERLIDLLGAASQKARAIMEERGASGDIDEVSQTIAMNAVKYADLSCLRTKDYVFSYDRMLRFEGNTAAFLMYSYVRVQGIKRRVGKTITPDAIRLDHPSEVALGLHLLRFSEVVEMVARDLLPNRLCDYLYELAEHFNAFFRDCRVEGSDEEASRLALCDLTARLLQQGMNLLGLKTVEQM